MYRHALYFEYGIRVVFISYMCHTDVIPTISCYNFKKNCLCRCVVSIPVFMPVSMSMHSSSIGQLYNKSKQSHPLLGKCPAYVAFIDIEQEDSNVPIWIVLGLLDKSHKTIMVIWHCLNHVGNTNRQRPNRTYNLDFNYKICTNYEIV